VFWKLLVLILSFSLFAAWLLTLRQERAQALSEITQAQLRINRQDERLWMLRSRIGERITPPNIEQLTSGLIELHPISPANSLSQAELARLADPNVVGPPSAMVKPPSLTPELASVTAARSKATPTKAKPTKAPTTGKATPAKVPVKAKPKPKGSPTRVAKAGEELLSPDELADQVKAQLESPSEELNLDREPLSEPREEEP